MNDCPRTWNCFWLFTLPEWGEISVSDAWGGLVMLNANKYLQKQGSDATGRDEKMKKHEDLSSACQNASERRTWRWVGHQ